MKVVWQSGYMCMDINNVSYLELEEGMDISMDSRTSQLPLLQNTGKTDTVSDSCYGTQTFWWGQFCMTVRGNKPKDDKLIKCPSLVCITQYLFSEATTSISQIFWINRTSIYSKYLRTETNINLLRRFIIRFFSTGWTKTTWRYKCVLLFVVECHATKQ